MDWSSARNVLCVRLDNMGDVIMATPAMRALKSAVSGRRLTLLTSPAAACLAPLLADVDEVIGFDAPWVKAADRQDDGGNLRRAVRSLRERRFDAAVVFTTYSQSPLPAAMMLFEAGVPARLAICRENPYQLLTHWVKEREPESGIAHEVQRQLDLVEVAGCIAAEDTRLNLRVGETDVRRVRSLLDEGSWFIVHPGSTAASRRYPPEKFAAAVEMLAGAGGLMPVFTGSGGESVLIEYIRRLIGRRTISLAGRLSIPELAALVSLAPLVITNNTVTSHIAAATGTPVVVLYALTNLQHTPWQVPSRVLYHDVPCKLCYKSICPRGHHDCLGKVAPEAVCKAALELLNFPLLH